MSIDPAGTTASTTVAHQVQVTGSELYWLPVETRVPLKFGSETLTSVTCARVRMCVSTHDGRSVSGWGETPLSVQWAWPANLSYALRHTALQELTQQLASAWADFSVYGHALEIGHAFQRDVLPGVLAKFNRERPDSEHVPFLAALICSSAFDLALYDAYGKALELPIYETLGPEFLSRDLAYYLVPAAGSDVVFHKKYPADFIVHPRPQRMPAWHLVGGLDPLQPADITTPVDDGYPVLLEDWIRNDGLKCLKVKLRGNDADWDYQRLVQVGTIGISHGVQSLTADFNCTVTDPEYVIQILNRLASDHAGIYQNILYVEQPFPYDLQEYQIDVSRLAAQKPLLMDESAHDWEHIKLGRSLGWNGVALKTCKTQTGALLSLCWARAHGMHLMVQDLTNPMLAQLSHLQLAAHAPTMMGVETNSMQFYPAASEPEAQVHPGAYQRRHGEVDITSVQGPGFGYRLDEMHRQLPAPAAQFGNA